MDFSPRYRANLSRGLPPRGGPGENRIQRPRRSFDRYRRGGILIPHPGSWFTVHTQHFSVDWAGDAVIVTFHGQRLQDENVEAMRADLLHALAAPRKVALSLGNVEFLASAALGLIAQIGRKVSSQGGRVVLCGVRPDVARLFSGPPYLTRDLPLFSDRDAALHALANGSV